MARAPRAFSARGATIVHVERSGCTRDHTVGPNIHDPPTNAGAAAVSACALDHTVARNRARTEETSVHADGLELLAPGIGDGGLAAIGKQDGSAVSRVQGIEQGTRRKLRGLRELLLHVLGADHLQVGDLAPAQKRERLDRKSTRLNSSHITISYA